MKTKIPQSVLRNSNVVTGDNVGEEVKDKVVTFSRSVPDEVPEDLVENGIVIVVDTDDDD